MTWHRMPRGFSLKALRTNTEFALRLGPSAVQIDETEKQKLSLRATATPGRSYESFTANSATNWLSIPFEAEGVAKRRLVQRVAKTVRGVELLAGGGRSLVSGGAWTRIRRPAESQVEGVRKLPGRVEVNDLVAASGNNDLVAASGNNDLVAAAVVNIGELEHDEFAASRRLGHEDVLEKNYYRLSLVLKLDLCSRELSIYVKPS